MNCTLSLAGETRALSLCGKIFRVDVKIARVKRQKKRHLK